MKFRITSILILLLFSFFLFKNVYAYNYITEQEIETDFESIGAQPYLIYTDDYIEGYTDNITLKMKTATTKYFSMAINTYESGTVESDCLQVTSTESYKTFTFKEIVSTYNITTFIQLQPRMYTTLENCNNMTGGQSASFIIYGSNDNPLDNSSWYNHSNQNFDPYILLREEPILEITDPLDNEYIPINKSYNFFGNCKNNGNDMLRLNLDFYFLYSDETDDYTIDCIDNEWTTTAEIYLGPNNYVIVDKNWIDNQEQCFLEEAENCDMVSFDGINEEYGFYLNIIYPECENNYCNKLIESDEWIFRFGYEVPDESYYSTEVINISGDCDSKFENCNDSLINNTILILDPDENGYIDTSEGLITVDSTERYYTIELWNEFDALDFRVNFRTKASTESDALIPKDPKGDLGFWGNIIRKLFVPRKRFILKYTDNIPEQIQGRIPFGYFYDIKNKLSEIENTEEPLDIELPIHIANINTSLKLISSEDEKIINIGEAFKPTIEIFLWLGFIWLVYSTIKNIEL